MAMSATGRMTWSQRVSTFAITGCVATYRPEAQRIAAPIRKTTANTDTTVTDETAKIGT